MPLWRITLYRDALDCQLIDVGRRQGLARISRQVSADKSQENGALLIAASIVAAIRLRGQEINPSPKLNAVVYDSISAGQDDLGAVAEVRIDLYEFRAGEPPSAFNIAVLMIALQQPHHGHDGRLASNWERPGSPAPELHINHLK